MPASYTSTDSGSIEWQINGTSLRNVNTGEGQIRREGHGEATEALIISALPQFNGTSVVCILYIIEPNGTVAFIESTPALLIIQGFFFFGHNNNIYIYIMYGHACSHDFKEGRILMS